MRTEVEAKFRVERDDAIELLRVRPRIGGVDLGPVRDADEIDRYLDTDDGRLSAQRWACRLRTRNGSVTVSLKGPGRASADGVHRRPEVEGAAAASLAPTDWPASAARTLAESLAAGHPLRERLRLLQHRAEREMRVGDRQIGTMSLDTVTVDAGGRELGTFHVVELELGDANAADEGLIAAMADVLLTVPGIRPEPHTKLERALAMAR